MGKNPLIGLNRSLGEAKELLIKLSSIVNDDDSAIVDAIEGETTLFEAIQEAVNAMDECDILLSGIKKKEEDIAARKKAVKERRDRIRAMIEQSLAVLDIKEPIRLPTMTLSLKKVPQGLIITDESLIPSEFWNQKPQPDPVLDKNALTQALKDKKEISGVELNNGGKVLSIRRA